LAAAFIAVANVDSKRLGERRFESNCAAFWVATQISNLIERAKGWKAQEGKWAW